MKLFKYLIFTIAIFLLASFEIEAQSGPYSAQIQRLLKSANTWNSAQTFLSGINLNSAGTATISVASNAVRIQSPNDALLIEGYICFFDCAKGLIVAGAAGSVEVAAFSGEISSLNSGGTGIYINGPDPGDVSILNAATFEIQMSNSIGWAIRTGANTACNTTCSFGCVYGQDTTTKDVVACTDASADRCLCAGAN